MHRVDHMKLCHSGVANLDLVKEFRNYSSDIAARFNGPIGDPAHQSTAPAPIDKTQSVIGNQFAEPVSYVTEFRVVSMGGTGKHADIFHLFPTTGN
jgi:hypothetical protein